MSARTMPRRGGFAGNLVAWGYALLIMAPMVWVLSNSFKRQIDILMGNTIAPATLVNYQNLLYSRQSNFLLNLTNSTIVATSATVLVLIIATLAAFTVVRLNPPRWVIAVVMGWPLIYYMLPTLTFVGAWYVMYSSVGLHGTLIGLISAHTVQNLPMALFLMSGFIMNIPRDLVQAARLDGCSYGQVFVHVILPLSLGGMAAAGALAFINSWSDFAIALNLTDKSTMTVPVAIATFAQEHQIRYGEMAAGSMLSMVPALTFILFGQRFVVRGLLAGAVK
jgi:multiple sugar transport system permease protein